MGRNLENLMTATAAGKLLGVGRQRIHQYRRTHGLPSTVIGGIHFFKEADLRRVKLKPVGWKKGKPRPKKAESASSR